MYEYLLNYGTCMPIIHVQYIYSMLYYAMYTIEYTCTCLVYYPNLGNFRANKQSCVNVRVKKNLVAYYNLTHARLHTMCVEAISY